MQPDEPDGHASYSMQVQQHADKLPLPEVWSQRGKCFIEALVSLYKHVP